MKKDSKPKKLETIPFLVSSTAESLIPFAGNEETFARKSRVAKAKPHVSLFSALPPSVLLDEQKTFAKRPVLDDALVSFPFVLALWKDLLVKFTKGKSGAVKSAAQIKEMTRANVDAHFDPVCDIFRSLLAKLDEGAEAKDFLRKAFSEELLYLAVAGINCANYRVLRELDNVLQSTDMELDESRAEKSFDALRLFHRFFFEIVRLRCNVVLPERPLLALQDCIKNAINELQCKIQTNFKLLVESPTQAKKLRAIALLLYYVMQSVAVLSVLGEPEGQTKGKYQSVLEYLKIIFALISQSTVFDRVVSDEYEFETSWTEFKGKQLLCGPAKLKRISLFVQEGKADPKEGLRINLRYVVVYYHYKILKLLAQRQQLMYDEHILSVFSTLIHKNKSLLGSLIAQRDKQSSMKVMLLINENIHIIKTYIINLAYFSDSLDPMQRLSKYDTIKETAIDCFALAVKSGMYWKSESPAEVAKLSIATPKDFVALLFRSLLLYKKVRGRHASPKFTKEMVKYINILAADLVSRPVPTDDAICFYSYRLYFLQFLGEWEIEDLKEKYTKYTEEISRYIADFEGEEMEGEVVKQLKVRNQDLALGLYLKLSQIDCTLPLETTIGFIKESYTSATKLEKYFFVTMSLLCRRKLAEECFAEVLGGGSGLLRKIIRSAPNSAETEVFIRKEGTPALFFIYKNALNSYMQTREQKASCLQESEKLTDLKAAASEINVYVAQTYMNKLDATIASYEQLINSTGAFICTLQYFLPIAEDFLMNSGFDQDFYERALKLDSGRTLILSMLQIFCEHLLAELQRSEFFEKYISIIIEIFVSLSLVHIPFEQEKPFVLTIVSVLEKLLLENEVMSKELREIIFHRAVLPLLLEVCQKENYAADIELFLRFLNLMKLIVRGNKLFYESKESKAQFYSFILSHFERMLTSDAIKIPTIQNLLKQLASIGVERDVEIGDPAPSLICEPSAIETYYNVLVRCFRTFPKDSNSHLKAYVLFPLESLRKSLLNACTLCRISLQELLVSILKLTGDKEFRTELVGHIARLNAIHTSPAHMQRLMHQLLKAPTRTLRPAAEDYYLSLLQVLIDSVSKESIRNMFYFTGQERSFIQLRTPLITTAPGLAWTGNIRLERGGADRNQCIFSFLRVKPNNVKGVELYTHERKLVYRMVNLYKGDNSTLVTLSNIELSEDTWHHITMLHFDKELIVCVDKMIQRAEVGMQCFPRKYNTATIGTATDPSTMHQQSLFFGEMSALYFFVPSAAFKDAMSDLVYRGAYLPFVYKNEVAAVDDNILYAFPEMAQCKGLKYVKREFVASTFFILDPKYNVFSRTTQEDLVQIRGRTMNAVGSLHDTQVFFNRPAKDVFNALGGFRTMVPLLASKFGFGPANVVHDSKICNAMLKLMYSLCSNGENEVIHFLMDDHGIDILKHLFEKIGRSGKFTAEFVDLFFQFLELPAMLGTKQSHHAASLLIEKILLNIKIWGNSDYQVQKRLMEKLDPLLMRYSDLPFTSGEPYRGILRLLYDYYAVEEVDDPALKKFLRDIRWQLTGLLLAYFQKYGTKETIHTLVEFLMPKTDSFYAIRDLLYILMLSQVPPHSELLMSYVKDGCKNGHKDFDLILALHSIINNAVVQKTKLKLVSAAEDLSVKSKIDCCEHVISYSMHILLSFCWNELFTEGFSSVFNFLLAPSTGPAPLGNSPQGNMLAGLNVVLNRGEGFLSLLNPSTGKGKYSRPEEIILHFLFHRLEGATDKGENYQRSYIGEKTYLALISHLLPDASVFYLNEKEIQQRVVEMKESEFNAPRIRMIYGTMFENTRAFELPVQQRLMLDTCKFLTNRAFMCLFLRIDAVFEAICAYLSRAKYLREPVIKSNLESFYLLFVRSYWKQRREHSQCIFRELAKFQPPEFLHLCNRILDELLVEPFTYSTDEGLYASIQFVYFLEDSAIRLPQLLTHPQFIQAVGKLLIYLNEVHILYFWFPSYVPGHVPREPLSAEAGTGGDSPAAPCCQREGGIVRAMLKLILTIIARCGDPAVEEKDRKLALMMLNFYIFRKRKTFAKIAKIFSVEHLICTEIESPTQAKSESIADPLLEFSLKGTVTKNKLKLILHDRSVTYQKPVEEICKLVVGKKDIYESTQFRALFLSTQILQTLIYSSFGVISYKALPAALSDCPDAEAEKATNYRTIYLSKLLGRILKFSYSVEGSAGIKRIIEDLYREMISFPDYPIQACISNIDACSRQLIESMRPQVECAPATPTKLKSTPVKEKLPGAEAPVDPMVVAKIRAYEEECIKCLTEVCEYYCNFVNKKVTAEKYTSMVLSIIMGKNFVTNVQPGLHKMVSEDLIVVEKAVLAAAEVKHIVQRRVSHPKVQPKENKERMARMHKIINECNQQLENRNWNVTKTDEEDNNEQEYENLRKLVLSESAFLIKDKEAEQVYQLAKQYYGKLLARCPLHKQQSALFKPDLASLPFDCFVKLNAARDNLCRELRLKPLRAPLENPSVLKGLAYVKRFFLKRALISRILRQSGVEPPAEFLIPGKIQSRVLKATMGRICKSHKHENSNTGITRLSLPAAILSPGKSTRWKVSASRLQNQPATKPLFSDAIFDSEIIRMDHSIFGETVVSASLIVFTSKAKDFGNPAYRLGSPSLMVASGCKKQKRVWRYCDIARVMVKQYNMIQQGIEIKLRNQKSVFLVLFSEDKLREFIAHFRRQTLDGRRYRIDIIEDPHKEFFNRKFTEDWRRRKLSNFEYLMLLNDYSSRSFQSLSQYPVFPWVLQNYTEPTLALSPNDFRDLKYPMAGITPRKRSEAVKKYENTDDFPEGRFQFGAHYLPGRAVLGYLMRQQPYTLMIYRFDSGGDCPSRHFHIMNTMWRNANEQSDTNLELVPEFYSSPEFLSNHNQYAFGAKVLEEEFAGLRGQIVYVDSVVLPPWARDPHYFICMMALALEHPTATLGLNDWIDLVFGDKQQSAESYNLFKPLTCEKTVKLREETEEGKLCASEVSQIAEFGHNPSQLFDRPHPSFEEKTYETVKWVFDVLSPAPEDYVAPQYRLKETETSAGIIRVIVRDKVSFLAITTNNEISRRQLISGKGEVRTNGQPIPLPRHYAVYNPTKEVFTLDPLVVFAVGGQYLVTCRNSENIFMIYSLNSMSRLMAVAFHTNVVNAVHYNERNDILYTGDIDGVVATWEMTPLLRNSSALRRPKYFMTDHNDAVVSIDANYELDLYASASKFACVLRVMSTNRYFLTISPELSRKVKYRIFKILLSSRGYIVIQARSVFATYEKDMLVVYSINGEKIATRELEEFLNAMILDQTQYFVITGGGSKRLKRYNIVTLDEEDLQRTIEGCPEFPSTVTSLSYMSGEKTTLLVGLANSQSYVVDFVSRQDSPAAKAFPLSPPQ